jgi:hypothetical protein
MSAHIPEVTMPTPAFTVLMVTLAPAVAGAQIIPPAMTAPGPQRVLVHHEDAEHAPPAQLMGSLPETWTVADWYKAAVYDLGDNKIGDILDVLVDHEGKNVAVIVGVGGFLGIGEKDVAITFSSIHFRQKDNKWFAVMNANKDALKTAPGYKFDRTARKWVPEAVTTGGGGK